MLLLIGNDDELGLVMRFAVQLGIGPVLVFCHQLIASPQLFSCMDVVDGTASATTDFLMQIAKQYLW